VFPAHAFAALTDNLPAGVQVPVCLWFCWSDAMVTPFGIVDVNAVPKESYYSFYNFTHSLSYN
jgi:hypothetical protein